MNKTQKDQNSAATSGVQRAKAKAESKDLIDRVPEELWTEVRDIVQEVCDIDQDHPQEKEMQKGKIVV